MASVGGNATNASGAPSGLDAMERHARKRPRDPALKERCHRALFDKEDDAAHAIFCRDSRKATGNFYLDEEVLRTEGVSDFNRYAVSPGHPLQVDLFVD